MNLTPIGDSRQGEQRGNRMSPFAEALMQFTKDMPHEVPTRSGAIRRTDCTFRGKTRTHVCSGMFAMMFA